MHVPDGFINAQVSAATGIISLGTLWAYIRNAKNLVADKLIALTGMMSALIFVLQMINFPIAAGTSGHLLGGALAVIVLGPSLGVICISIVVVIQSLLFADGGLSALGVNVLNMAIITSLTGWFTITLWKKLFGESQFTLISGSVIAGLLSVVFSSIAFVLEYAIGGTVSVPLGNVLIAMISTHLLIGLGEGIITALIVSLLLRVRSDLVYVNSKKNKSNTLSTSYGVLIALILSLTLVTPYASSSPDGLESVASDFGFEETDGVVLLLEDYGISSINNNFVSTTLSALLGVLAIAGLGTLFFRNKSGKN
ncbi:MAG: energy-coupling factor ABC transporter permease [Candidatus Actinomarina sp.]|jgi:cobalt/nickel transport system permease protein|nr:cobalt ABC transporter permease [Actinomycetota bacterium]MDA9593384.1 energy-coupling factor ABC transporter permease [Candidatus Actinomarina sp.]MDA9608302.1 energy-coupling factor ABC transporter permease [Candidatus Actinomarina sp.]|tara:strand:- start:126 stop:1055 length:930 start_codon:yes stop_codon:yes gene_type:complete